jgi:hypothetical protein
MARGVNPFAAWATLVRLFFSLTGLNIEVESPGASVQVRLI